MPASSRILVSAASVVVFVALALILTPQLRFGVHHNDGLSFANQETAFRAPKANIWAELTDTEADDISDFLYKGPNDLNLSHKPIGNKWHNQLGLIEVLQPNKSEVLPFLDASSSTPRRWARVAVIQGDFVHARYVNYMVGPLPVDHKTQILPLEYCYNSGRNSIRIPLMNLIALGDREQLAAINISDITEDLLGARLDVGLNETNPNGIGLSLGGRATRIEDGDMTVWMQIYRLGTIARPDTLFLLPQGLYFKLNFKSRDIIDWSITQWYYNGITYPSIDAFRAAWEKDDFVKLKPNLDGDWTQMEDYDSNPKGRNKPPAVAIQPYGPRYSLSKKDQYVEYLGWSFYLSTSAARGLDLFDVRFQGDRIMFSLGLQEALAHYAGSDPSQGGLEFLDSFFGFGASMFELVPGYDCPAYADFLPLEYHFGGDTITKKNAICIFEFTDHAPLSRHTSQFYTTISKNTYLIVRVVSTVGNYDYTIDYTFYLDGSLEVKVRASGFIFGAFFPQPPNSTQRASPQQHEYGYRVHDAAGSSMHDHVLNFRADMDIDGVANTLTRIAIEPLVRKYDWDPPDLPGPRSTMHMVHHPVETETGLNWPSNSGEMYVILNNNSLNEWGEKRGYRIAPGLGMGTPAHLTIKNSTALGKSASWAYKDLWLLRQHDTEPKTASELNFLEPTDPLVDFAKMVDGEGVVQEDLVVAFNLGGHHVPVSGDIPNTMMHTSASSVMFVPHNFGKRDLSRSGVSGVRIDREGARYFGGVYEEGAKLEKEQLEPDLSGYAGEIGEEGRQILSELSFDGTVVGKMHREMKVEDEPADELIRR
jgi:primary-amine oxidase